VNGLPLATKKFRVSIVAVPVSVSVELESREYMLFPEITLPFGSVKKNPGGRVVHVYKRLPIALLGYVAVIVVLGILEPTASEEKERVGPGGFRTTRSEFTTMDARFDTTKLALEAPVEKKR
jgi:hypothetical protein